MDRPDVLLDEDSLLNQLFKTTQKTAMVLMDTDGYIIKINDVFTRSFGYKNVDLEDKHMREFFTKEDRKKNLPERELATVKIKSQSSDNNYVLHKNGRKLWVQGESIFIKSGKHQFIFKILQNLDEQKRLEEFLQETNDFVENIFHHIQDFIVVVSPEMKVMKINSSFFSALMTEKVEGKNFAEILKSSHCQKLKRIVQDTVNGVLHSPFEFEIEVPDGSTKYYMASATSMEKYQNKEERVLLTFHEITSEKIIEEQREDLINFVSHELKNPLTSISLYSELLGNDPEIHQKTKPLNYLKKINDNIGYIQTLVDDLYEVTKAGSGHLVINKEECDLEELVAEAVSTFEISYPKRKISRNGTTKKVVAADKHRLLQVVMNFLQNATKYSDKEIVLEIREMRSKIRFGVIDYGSGIPQHKLPYLFNKYYRAQSGKEEGTGLGLYIAKQIILAHHGEVWVESEEGKGSAFYFTLPAS